MDITQLLIGYEPSRSHDIPSRSIVKDNVQRGIFDFDEQRLKDTKDDLKVVFFVKNSYLYNLMVVFLLFK